MRSRGYHGAMTTQTIHCPHCPATFEIELGPEGKGLLRRDLVRQAPEMAAHARSHGDETAAIRMERYAVTPAPEFGERRPTNG